MKIETSKQKLELKKAQDKYSECSKRYSKVLSNSLKLDQSILSIAQEIAKTGEQISIHDNRFLTEFIAKLSENSNIDKKYHRTVLELKKTKAEFDQAAYQLMRARVDYILPKAGLPPKRHNLSNTNLAAIINSPKTSPLEKISIGLPMLRDESMAFEEFIDNGEITFENGQVVAKSKAARDFVKSFEAKVKKLINDKEYKLDNPNVLASYVEYNNHGIGLLTLLRVVGDNEHVRELERKLAAGDVYVSNTQIIPVTRRGGQYTRLLSEELRDLLEKKVTAEFLRVNQESLDSNPRLMVLKESTEGLAGSLRSHQKYLEIAGEDSEYGRLVGRADKDYLQVRAELGSLLTDIDGISTSYIEIKKKLLLITNEDEIDVEKYLSLLAALKLLAIHERGLEQRIDKLSAILRVEQSAVKRGPKGISELADKYHDVKTENELDISDLVTASTSKRADFGRKIDEITKKFIEKSPNYARYRQVVREQGILKRYISDELAKNQLYGVIHDTSHLVSELVDLDIEKRELLAEVQHEIELVHKKLWCQSISEANKQYLETTYSNLSENELRSAFVENRRLVTGAEKEVAKVVNFHNEEHKLHSNEFQEAFTAISSRLKNGEDVTEIARDIQERYRKLVKKHNEALVTLDLEMKRLDTYLLEFSKGSRKQLDKALITDIKNRLQ